MPIRQDNAKQSPLHTKGDCAEKNCAERESGGGVDTARNCAERESGDCVILGIDEVGRGPWAGPLVVGAVILGENFKELPEYQELNDSKKLTARKRERLNELILQRAVATGLGWVTAAEIDKWGLGASLRVAARRAAKQLLSQKTRFTEIVIDGTINLLEGTPLDKYVVLLPKADALVKEVSAASIIAKVARDNYMSELAETYPGYGFEKHVGYGTAAHKQALLDLGVTPEHRKSFRPVREIAERMTKQPDKPVKMAQEDLMKIKVATEIGHRGELAICEYLEKSGHRIVATNYKTKTYEIDIISVRDDAIYFTEVKARKTADYGSPLEAITAKKRQQIRYAAELFMTTHLEFAGLQPILAAASVMGADFETKDWMEI